MAKIVVVKSRALTKAHHFELASQLIRSGTNPGAMVQEYRYAESRRDKRHKLAIAMKEAAETRYWACLLFDTDLLDKRSFVELIDAVNPVIALLVRTHKALS